MSKIKFRNILVIFILLFIVLTTIYYQKTKSTAIENAQVKIEEFLLNYKALRAYISNIQKLEVYRLQENNKLDPNYFNPILLSSTYGARNVNEFYNVFRKQHDQKPIIIRFASDNPRNLKNKANEKESKLLKQFNENKIEKHIEIIEDEKGTNLYYVLPTRKTTPDCMKCHSDPKLAPKGLVEHYGDKHGFYEKVGDIRAILSTTYPLDEDLKVAKHRFISITFVTFIVFSISLLVVFLFTKKIENKNDELESLNKNLDNKVKERTQELEKEKHYIEALLNNTPNIILVTTGKELLDCNKRLLEFFEFDTIEQFKEQHSCICEYFDLIDENKLSEDKEIDGMNWCLYIVQKPFAVHTVSLTKNNEKHYFNISAIYLHKDKNEILVSLQNITELKKKDHVLIQQSKMASIADMLNNIAHQWRQPLSVISTASTGMLLKQEYGMLNNETIEKNLNLINKTSQNLSNTIDNFSSYFTEDQKNTVVDINEVWQNAIDLIDAQYKDHTIEIVRDCEKIEIYGMKNDILQIFISFLSNTKDAHATSTYPKKYLFINMYKQDDMIIIAVKDNAGGIKEDIIPNIFEPYFTTKHKSVGTGLGLYMVYETVINKLKGSIKVQNVEFEYEKNKYKGVEFIIKIPTKI